MATESQNPEQLSARFLCVIFLSSLSSVLLTVPVVELIDSGEIRYFTTSIVVGVLAGGIVAFIALFFVIPIAGIVWRNPSPLFYRSVRSFAATAAPLVIGLVNLALSLIAAFVGSITSISLLEVFAIVLLLGTPVAVLVAPIIALIAFRPAAISPSEEDANNSGLAN